MLHVPFCSCPLSSFPLPFSLELGFLARESSVLLVSHNSMTSNPGRAFQSAGNLVAAKGWIMMANEWRHELKWLNRNLSHRDRECHSRLLDFYSRSIWWDLPWTSVTLSVRSSWEVPQRSYMSLQWGNVHFQVIFQLQLFDRSFKIAGLIILPSFFPLALPTP